VLANTKAAPDTQICMETMWITIKVVQILEICGPRSPGCQDPRQASAGGVYPGSQEARDPGYVSGSAG
jgi:hypothetical protein